MNPDLLPHEIYRLRQAWLGVLEALDAQAREMAADRSPEIRALATAVEALAGRARGYLYRVDPTRDPVDAKAGLLALNAELRRIQAKLDQLAASAPRSSAAGTCTYRGAWGPCTARTPHRHGVAGAPGASR